jgi:hypothetical protein
MKGLLLSGALLAACATYAKDKPAYQTGVLLQMDSTSCGMAEKGGKTITGRVAGDRWPASEDRGGSLPGVHSTKRPTDLPHPAAR